MSGFTRDGYYDPSRITPEFQALLDLRPGCVCVVRVDLRSKHMRPEKPDGTEEFLLARPPCRKAPFSGAIIADPGSLLLFPDYKIELGPMLDLEQLFRADRSEETPP
jgi:hypothetical protein